MKTVQPSGWELKVSEDGWRDWKLTISDLVLEVFPHGDAWENEPIDDDKAHWSGWFGTAGGVIWQVQNQPRTLKDQQAVVYTATVAWLRKQLRMMTPGRRTGLSKLYDKMKEETDRDPLFADIHLSALDTLDLVEDLLDHHAAADDLARSLGLDPEGAPHIGDLVGKLLERMERERQHGRDEMLIAAIGKVAAYGLDRKDLAIVVAALETARRDIGRGSKLARFGDVTIGRSERRGALEVVLQAGDHVVASVEVLEGATLDEIEEALCIVLASQAALTVVERTRVEWIHPFIDRTPTATVVDDPGSDGDAPMEVDPQFCTYDAPSCQNCGRGYAHDEHCPVVWTTGPINGFTRVMATDLVATVEGCIMKGCTAPVVYEGPTGTLLCQGHLDQAKEEMEDEEDEYEGETDSPE